MTRSREVSGIPNQDAGRPRAWITRCLTALGVAMLLVVPLDPSTAFADDNDSDQGTGGVTISVTIGPFDPCAVQSPDCSQLPTLALPDPLGDLVTSGSLIGLPLGAGALLVATGACAVLAVTSRRRRSIPFRGAARDVAGADRRP